jgi:hypothetical protein
VLERFPLPGLTKTDSVWHSSKSSFVVMHRIRLREPWKASLTDDPPAVVYTRNFHKPTGVAKQSITLCISLHTACPEPRKERMAVILNSVEILAQVSESQVWKTSADNLVLLPLKELEPFNSLQIRITGASPTIVARGPDFEASVIPTFGSFVIESVELQIE